MEILGRKEKAKSPEKDCGIVIKKGADGKRFGITFGADVSDNFRAKAVKIGKDEAKLYLIIVPYGNGYTVKDVERKDGTVSGYIQIGCEEITSVLENYQGYHKLLKDEHGFFITPSKKDLVKSEEIDGIEKLYGLIEAKDTIIRKNNEFIARQARIINKLISETRIHVDDLAELCNFCEEELKNAQ